jgi:hypothetical protein
MRRCFRVTPCKAAVLTANLAWEVFLSIRRAMKHWFRVTSVLAALVTAAPAMAADLHGYSAYSQCLTAEQSQLATLPDVEIEVRVGSFYDEAGRALQSADVLGSRRPAFLWARETRFQCGKALGYLDGGYVDEDSVGKCDCAHSRLVQFW